MESHQLAAKLARPVSKRGRVCYDPAMTDAQYDIYSHAFKADPHPTFDAMRRDCPVHHQIGLDGHSMLYFATSYEAVERILTDDRHFARDLRAHGQESGIPDPDIDNLVNNHMLSKDGDDHRRLRTLVSQAFTPRRVREMRPRIQAIADELIDGVIARGQMDLIGDFSYHLPTIVILEMLGIPAADRDRFRNWTKALIMPSIAPDEFESFMTEMAAFLAYLRVAIADRRANPTDDMLSALVHAEESGDALSEGELFGMLMLLIVAGHETTVNLIANGLVALWRNPAQLAALVANPALMPAAVEEFLRYDGSVERGFARYVLADVELGGRVVPQGSLIIPILGAGSHDPAVFDRPDALDITRVPNPHLGFGKGSHYCLGAPLARLETEIALNTLLRRLPGLQPAVTPHELRWRLTPMFRSLEALPVEWGNGS